VKGVLKVTQKPLASPVLLSYSQSLSCWTPEETSMLISDHWFLDVYQQDVND